MCKKCAQLGEELARVRALAVVGDVPKALHGLHRAGLAGEARVVLVAGEQLGGAAVVGWVGGGLAGVEPVAG